MAEKQFKYAEWLERLPNCPPSEYTEVSKKAFRFVYSDLNNPNNFKPAQVLKPSRQFQNDVGRCLALGLSVFEQSAQAVAFFKFQTRRFPAFGKIVGDHLAEIFIEPDDGLASTPEETNFGHFTFHEYIWCDFLQKIRSVEPLSTNI